MDLREYCEPHISPELKNLAITPFRAVASYP